MPSAGSTSGATRGRRSRTSSSDFAARGAPWVALALERGSAGSSLNVSLRHRVAAGAALATVAALGLRRPGIAAAALSAMMASNMSFYVLLGRRGGARLALAGVPLHLLHHLTAALSVPAGVVLYARRSGR